MGADTGVAWIPSICCAPGTLQALHIRILIHPSQPSYAVTVTILPIVLLNSRGPEKSHSQQAADDNVPPDSQGGARDERWAEQ